MMPETWLVAFSGALYARGAILALDHTIVLGRWVDAEIRPQDPEVARRHSRFRPTPEGVLVEDLGSTKGSHVNGVPITSAILRDGDSYSVGSSLFSVVVGPRSRAEDVAAHILTTEASHPYIFEGMRGIARGVSKGVFEATVHRRPFTLLTFGWRKPDPIGLATIVKELVPAASHRTVVAFRVFAIAADKPDLAELAARAGVHVGIATLGRPTDHPGPYDTQDPVGRMFDASRSALEIALATDEAVCEAEPVLLRPA